MRKKAKTYLTGKPCVNGHTGPRYVLGRSCVECQTNTSLKAYAKWKDAGRPLRTPKTKMRARAKARANGDRTYVSDSPCYKGHTAWRLVTNAVCSECARERAAKYRLAKGIKPHVKKANAKPRKKLEIKETAMNTEDETFNAMVKRLEKENNKW